MFRSAERTVFPHSAKFMPEKPCIAHSRKAAVIRTVLPVRTAPSQMIAPRPCWELPLHHQHSA